MNRRNIFSAILAGSGAAVALAFGAARAQEKPQVAKAQGEADARPRHATKVAYHLSEIDRVNFVLGNIKNHIEGTGGPGMIEIVLVVHGPALRAFRKAGIEPQVSQRMTQFSKAGVKFDVCANTMHAMKLDVADLVPGFSVVEEGGVVRLADLQAQGYAYLRP
jgi:intracellular sulfur oxidation DsrE/DsrF family protein